MKITAEIKNEFWHWMNDTWNQAGGLITHSIAASMMGKTQTRIRQMVQEGKLTEYQFKRKKFVSFQQVISLTRDEAYEDLKNATELLYKQGAEMMLKIISEQQKRTEKSTPEKGQE